MSVLPRVERFEEVCFCMVCGDMTLALSSDIIYKEIDRKTFLEMWVLSRSGGDDEERFLRFDQTEFYDTRIPRPNPIETLPNVSSPRTSLLPI